MATLQKIRGKAGLLVGVIGVALLAFIVGDLLNSGHTFFNMNRNKIAVVNGKKLLRKNFRHKFRLVPKRCRICIEDNMACLFPKVPLLV